MKTASKHDDGIRLLPRCGLLVLTLVAMLPANAAMLVFNSGTPAENVATRADWLVAAGIASPAYLIDFENGYTDGQNVSGVDGLFPGGLLISSSDNSAIVRSGTGSIGGSNPVGSFALSHSDSNAANLTLDFTAFPVDYLAFQDIDSGRIEGLATFVGGATTPFQIESTGTGSNSAEFVGLFRNDMPRIVKVDLNASGGSIWGVDNVEFGPVVPLPATVWLLATGVGAVAARRAMSKSRGA